MREQNHSMEKLIEHIPKGKWELNRNVSDMIFFLYQMEKSPIKGGAGERLAPPAIMKNFIKLYLAASFDDVSISRNCAKVFPGYGMFVTNL